MVLINFERVGARTDMGVKRQERSARQLVTKKCTTGLEVLLLLTNLSSNKS